MKRFLRKFLLLLVPVVACLSIYIYIFADGTSDLFYLRFTTPRFPSLILGSSRAAQGIRPHIFNKSDLIFERHMYNFSFTIGHSPWGPLYLKAIEKKLNPDSKNGLFILEVNPATISMKKGARVGAWPEKDLCINNYFVTMNPNVEYMLKYYEKPLYRLSSFRDLEDQKVLDKDGWARLSIPMAEKIVNKRKKDKFKEYQKRFQESTLSEKRLEYLEKTMNFLMGHGKVVLVRMPSSEEIFELEASYMPDFDDKMQKLSQKYDSVYINLAGDYSQYQTTDGSHLYRESSQMASEAILAALLADPRYGQVLVASK